MFLSNVDALQLSCTCTTLGVLCCFALFVCLILLASFFLPSHLSLKTCTYCIQHVLALPCLFVCLTLLASFFLPSHLSFKNMYICR